MKIFKDGDKAISIRDFYPWCKGEIIHLNSSNIDVESGLEFFRIDHPRKSGTIPLFAPDLYTNFVHFLNAPKIWREVLT